jgi:snapalysin
MTPRRLIATVAALGAAALAVPAAAAAPTAAPAPATTSNAATIAAYTGSAADQAATKAFYDAVWSSVKSRGKPTPGTVTVTYNASKAPSFRTEIGKTQTIWNGSVTRVKLAEVTGAADFEYREGNDPRGSYASTDGRGHGYVFLDYEQNQVYNSTRVTSHETGHILGLPDHYSGPCSELMSGGGPGPSCTNAYPDATERAKVDRLWSRGGALAEAAFVTVR